MNEILNDINKWQTAGIEEKNKAAKDILKNLPDSFLFKGISDTTFKTALYDCKGALFVLVPGMQGRQLGYEDLKSFELSAEQLDDYKKTEEEFGYTLEDFLDDHQTPLRTVNIKPLLVEMNPFKYDCYEFDSLTELTDDVCKGGFRLLTTDEWEYVYSGNSRTLFPWGNNCPVDEMPYGEIKFKLHLQPNAFGVVYTGDTYDTELCADEEYRYGDGGEAVCGSYGNFASWLSLSSSYVHPETDEWDVEEIIIRRVFDISG